MKILLLSAFVAASVVSANVASAASCESLRSVSLPHVTIIAAEVVAPGPFQPPALGPTSAPPPAVRLPGHCRVAAVLKPSADSHIEVEIWLPTDNWNGKFQAVGNGGWAGAMTYGGAQGVPRSMAFALREGYATASTDTGHRNDGTQGKFVIGHPEKLVDFAYRAVHEMTIASKAVITAFYGRAPMFSYWNGCSTGGRQGLLTAQRFPEDFDGIVAGAPANYWTHLMAGIIWGAQAAHVGQPGNLPADKLSLLHDAVISACDRLDGVRDGVLQDPRRCTFDVKQLQCKSADQSSCLTVAQVEAAERMYAGARNPRTNEPIYPGMALGSELGWDPVNGLQPFAIAESHFRDVVFNDPKWDYRTLDFDRGVAAADKTDSGLITAIDPNLQRFFARGGKLIQYHGWNDQQISPYNSIDYYRTVEAKLGPDTVRKSYRLFMAPGMMHCGAGDGPNQFNPIAALERWRESNVPPNAIIATHVTNGIVDAARPLCPYPQVAVYKGNGSPGDAVNYSCRIP